MLKEGVWVESAVTVLNDNSGKRKETDLRH